LLHDAARKRWAGPRRRRLVGPLYAQERSAAYPSADCQPCALSAVSNCNTMREQKLDLFDYLVDEREKLCWHIKAERPCRLEVDHQLEARWPFNRQVGGAGNPGNNSMSESICVDCGIDTCPRTGKRGSRRKGRWEYYMVHNAVWAKAGMEPDGGHLCIGCLERRLGRMLRPRDFTDAPINDPDIPWRTKRLVSRLKRPAA